MGSLFGLSCGQDATILGEMAARLAHRGSSYEFFNTPFGGAVAGHCEGLPSQPWFHERLAMVGELKIFNCDDLIQLLADNGIDKYGADAGQLLLTAWSLLGSSALLIPNGDFAVAIIELDTGRIHLARDRSGAKPLYYARCGKGWCFASEYKALLTIADLDREIDLEALQLLHSKKVVPATRTLLKNVRQVPAQSFVTLDERGSSSAHRYWRAGGAVGRPDFAWHRDQISKRFLHAVELRTKCTERLGISISGGIDSIAMLAAARKTHPDATIRTYTIGDSSDDPEVTVARNAAEYYRTEHHEQIFSTDNLSDRMRQLVWGLEDPIARTESLMTSDVCSVACGDVDVMLRGDGADGLFGGMARHKILALAERIPLSTSTLVDVYNFTQSGVLPKNWLSRSLIKVYFRSKIPAPPKVLGHVQNSGPNSSNNNASEILNQTLWKGPEHALPMLLQKVERPHAQRGMQSVSPFLDNDLVDAAHRVPSLFKNNGRRGKIVFREAACLFLPEKFAQLPKYAQRVRETEEFCDALEVVARENDVLRSLVDRRLFRSEDVSNLLQRPSGGIWPPEHAMRVWTLINTEFWAQIFVDHGGKSLV